VSLYAEGMGEGEALSLAASLEAVSEHPLARAVLEAAQERQLSVSGVEGFRAESGMGVVGTVEGRSLLLGNERLLAENGVTLQPEMKARLEALADDGQTPLLLAVDGCFTAMLGVADPLREETPAVIAQLKELGCRVLMLSGDNERTARAVAAKAGISDVIAGVRPDGKEAVIARLQSEGRRVAMVGDGINDAPALARADVGMAMGSGIDVAMEAGDVVLLRGLGGVKTAICLGRATLANIRLSLFWAFGYNVLLIPAAAGVLLLFGGPAMSPMLAGAAMSLSSVSVVTNALRLRRFEG
jgi:Cu+-exporting ATPase